MPHPAMVRATRLFSLSLAGFLVAALTFAPETHAQTKALTSKEIYARTIKSAAWVLRVEKKEGDRVAIGGTGSGSLIDLKQGLVLTNYHVVGEKEFALVVFPSFDKDGKVIAEKGFYMERVGESAILGKVLARDSKRDLAIIQLPEVPKGVTALRLASESLGPGEAVRSIGNPGASGALWAYTSGDVKAVYQKKFRSGSKGSDKFIEVDAKVVETTSPVNPGDSGGPVVNERAELAAVTQGGIFDEEVRAISFFIDISEVRAFLKDKKIKIAESPASTATVAKPEPGDKPADDERSKQAASKLEFAKDLIAGKPDKAVERLNDIVKQFPETDAAKEAKELLVKLKK